MTNTRSTLRMPVLDNSTGELFCRFVTGLVHRVNSETFRIDLKKVEVDFALDGFQAEVDRQSMTLTISAYAVEFMPKRLSRCKIVHLLAQFLYPVDSADFQREVEAFEPHYESLLKQFEISFNRSLKEGMLRAGKLEVSRSNITGELERPRLLVAASKKPKSALGREIAEHCDELLARSKSPTVNKFDRPERSDIEVNTKNGASPLAVV